MQHGQSNSILWDPAGSCATSRPATSVQDLTSIASGDRRNPPLPSDHRGSIAQPGACWPAEVRERWIVTLAVGKVQLDAAVNDADQAAGFVARRESTTLARFKLQQIASRQQPILKNDGHVRKPAVPLDEPRSLLFVHLCPTVQQTTI